MAKRTSRTERHEAHRREVEGHKRRLREEMQDDGHIYGREWYREAVRKGDAPYAEALDELMGEIDRHNRDNPAPPNFGMDDGRERAQDLDSRRREARDIEKAAGIAEAARKKAAGIGGGVFATAEPEPEEIEDDEPDPQAVEYEQQRRTLASHGLVSRMPAPPQEGRRKRRRGYSYPPFSS